MSATAGGCTDGNSPVKWQLCYDVTARTWWMVSVSFHFWEKKISVPTFDWRDWPRVWKGSWVSIQGAADVWACLRHRFHPTFLFLHILLSTLWWGYFATACVTQSTCIVVDVVYGPSNIWTAQTCFKTCVLSGQINKLVEMDSLTLSDILTLWLV